MVTNTLLLSLTTLHERHGYTYYIQKVRYSSISRNSMPWWRERREILLSDFKPTMVENTSPGSSKNISPSMESEKTVPDTPQHNGVAERMNQTIVEKGRCMLKLAKLPKSFWGESVNTAVYLIIRLPLVPLDFDIP